MKPKKRGRPKLAADAVKAERLELRMTGAEKAGFSAAAKLSGLALASWIRLRLRESARAELQREGQTVPFLA